MPIRIITKKKIKLEDDDELEVCIQEERDYPTVDEKGNLIGTPIDTTLKIHFRIIQDFELWLKSIQIEALKEELKNLIKEREKETKKKYR